MNMLWARAAFLDECTGRDPTSRWAVGSRRATVRPLSAAGAGSGHLLPARGAETHTPAAPLLRCARPVTDPRIQDASAPGGL